MAQCVRRLIARGTSDGQAVLLMTVQKDVIGTSIRNTKSLAGPSWPEVATLGNWRGRFISYQRGKNALAKSHMKATYVSYGAGIVSCTNTWLLLALAPSPARPLSSQSKSTEAGNATMSFCIQPGREIP